MIDDIARQDFTAATLPDTVGRIRGEEGGGTAGDLTLDSTGCDNFTIPTGSRCIGTGAHALVASRQRTARGLGCTISKAR